MSANKDSSDAVQHMLILGTNIHGLLAPCRNLLTPESRPLVANGWENKWNSQLG
jgi:hypothetical protein